MIVADTDVLIDYFEDRNPGAAAVRAELERDHLVTTAVNCFELLAGARRPHEREAVLTLLNSVRLLPLDSDAAIRAAEVRRHLDRIGAGIGMGDSLIAGIALANEASLLTRNQRHFARIPGLALCH